MRVVIQRVLQARVEVEGSTVGSIGRGLLVFVGVGQNDNTADADYLADKIARLRIFPDAEGKMNLDVQQVGGAVLVISQFTLYGDARRGNRPGFQDAAPAEQARILYEYLVQALRLRGLKVETGVFQASMLVELINDGPVTIYLDTKI